MSFFSLENISEQDQQTVEALIGATRKLIELGKSLDFSMQDIAGKAGVDIAKAQVLFKEPVDIFLLITQSYFVDIRRRFEEELKRVNSNDDFATAAESWVNSFYETARDDVVKLVLWLNMDQHEELKTLATQNRKANARLLADAVLRVHPKCNYESIYQSTWLLMQMASLSLTNQNEQASKENFDFAKEFRDLIKLNIDTRLPSKRTRPLTSV